MAPRVSIGLPVYNGELYLREALTSLCRQSWSDFEIIICDNASTDSTREICEEFTKHDPRIRYVCNAHNLGAARNFNKSVHLATGEYFFWANHDDLWAVTYVEKCVAALDSNPGAVNAYSRSVKVDGAGRTVAQLKHALGLDGSVPARRLRRFHDLFQEIDRVHGWSEDDVEGIWIPVYGVMRIELLHKTALIGSYISSDTTFLEELLLVGAFVEVPEVLFRKRDHPGRSMRASMAYDKRSEWFTGRPSSRFLFPRARILAGRIGAVMRSPLTLREKSACMQEMLGFYIRRAHEAKALAKECLINARVLCGIRWSSGKALRKW